MNSDEIKVGYTFLNFKISQETDMGITRYYAHSDGVSYSSNSLNELAKIVQTHHKRITKRAQEHDENPPLLIGEVEGYMITKVNNEYRADKQWCRIFFIDKNYNSLVAKIKRHIARGAKYANDLQRLQQARYEYYGNDSV